MKVMSFSCWLEGKAALPPVNRLGREIAPTLNLKRGAKAFNQVEPNCYEIAREVASRFGYQLPTKKEILDRYEQLQHYWATRQWNPQMQAPQLPEPRSPALLLARHGEQLSLHVSVEYKGREYNYGPANSSDYKVIFKLPLRPA